MISAAFQPSQGQSTVSLFDGSSQSSNTAPQGGTAAFFNSLTPQENSTGKNSQFLDVNVFESDNDGSC